MCENPLYALMVKTEYDEKFKRFGVRSKMRILCYVRDVHSGKCNIPRYNYKKYNLLIKECGKCRCCRFKQAAKKAAQAYCEAKTHEKNCFLTLTFDKEKLIKHYKEKFGKNYYMINKMVAMCEWSLEKEHFRNFIKRLRFKLSQEDEKQYCIDNNLTQFLYDKKGKPYKRIRLSKKYKDLVPYRKIKVLHCGEYGELGHRPHHHCIIFGYDFNDTINEVYYRQGKLEERNVSKELDGLWSLGDCTCDKCTYNSMNYVARYVTKKVTGKHKDFYYQGRMPEYCTQSNRRGLGYDYFCNHYKEFINTEKIALKSSKGKILNIPLPRYFRELWKVLDPGTFNNSVEKNIKKSQEIFENIKRVGLISNLDSKSNIIKNVFKKCIRNFERCESLPQLQLIYKKALAYGIDLELFHKYSHHYQKYLLNKSYKDFGEVYKDSDNYDKYKSFENWRKRAINNLKYDLNISDEQRYLKEDFYIKLDNPFKVKGYTSKIYKYPQRDFVAINFESPLEERVALYA